MGIADPAPVSGRRRRADAAPNACPADANLQPQQSARSAPGRAGSGLTDDAGHLAGIGAGKQRKRLSALFDHQGRAECAVRSAPSSPCRAAPCRDEACRTSAQTVAARGRRSVCQPLAKIGQRGFGATGRRDRNTGCDFWMRREELQAVALDFRGANRRPSRRPRHLRIAVDPISYRRGRAPWRDR